MNNGGKSVRVAPEYNELIDSSLAHVNSILPRRKQLNRIEYTRLLAQQNKLALGQESLIDLIRSVEGRFKNSERQLNTTKI